MRVCARVCDKRALRLAGGPRNIYSTMAGGPNNGRRGGGRRSGWGTLAKGFLASHVTNSSHQVKLASQVNTSSQQVEWKIRSLVERTTPDHQCQTFESIQTAWPLVTECKPKHMVGRAHGPHIWYNGGCVTYWSKGVGVEGVAPWSRVSKQEGMSSGKTQWETLPWKRQLPM